jgi:hypothetical protein
MLATLRLHASFALLAWSPAFAQTICHDPPAGMKEVVAELTLENRLLKKSMTADGEDAA